MLYASIIILIILIIIAVLMSSVIIGLIRTRGVPFISTNKKDFKQILAAVDLKTNEKIYDLGCGKASLLILAAQKYGAKGVGYELSLWPYLWAKFNSWKSRADVDVYLKDFFTADLSDADVVFCYLFTHIMGRLEQKFEREMKPGSRVVAYGFKLPHRQPVKEIITNDDNVELGKIYVYRY